MQCTVHGRIAQLVELLSYTQAVIGSSPVAPNIPFAGVVQLVRAPACHAGSCGFDPRLPRLFFILFITLLSVACQRSSLEDFKDEGQSVVKSIVDITKHIQSREMLLDSSRQLQHLFEELVDVMIAAQEYRYRHPNAEKNSFSEDERGVNDHLRAEINRLCRIDGGQEIIEKCQEKALNRLDAYLQKTKLRKKMASQS